MLSLSDFEKVLKDEREQHDIGKIIRELKPEYDLGETIFQE
jgi:hypothetical protein